MQMNLSDLVVYYIEYTFHETTRRSLYTAFALMETFGVQFYEDKYVNLISREDSLDQSAKMDNFRVMVMRDLLDIVQEHGIALDAEADLQLHEVCEVVNFLYLIQHLDDYAQLSYRLFAADTDRRIVVDLLNNHSNLSYVRAMEIVKAVDPFLTSALKDYVQDKAQQDDQPLSGDHLSYTQAFFKYTSESPSLGKTLWDEGYRSLELPELTRLIRFDLVSHVKETIKRNPAQAALDVFSLLVITTPVDDLLGKFSEHSQLFSQDTADVTRLKDLVGRMFTNYNSYLEATRQAGVIHGQQA